MSRRSVAGRGVDGANQAVPGRAPGQGRDSRARPPVPRPDRTESVTSNLSAVTADDHIEQGLAEHLPWADSDIDLGITSPPYCLGEKIAYADGGDYENYAVSRDELVPARCRQLSRVANPDGGRWCINVPIDIAGRSRV